MFKSRKKRSLPELNTTSTADISFMLLIFFLVTSSMDSDEGLARQLPTPEDPTEEQELVVKKRNVLLLALDAADRLTCNGDSTDAAQLAGRVADFVANAAADPELPELSERDVHLLGRCKVSDRHVIFLRVDPAASYNAYFEMQNAILAGYNQLRDALAQSRFGHAYAQCNAEQRDAVAMVYPQRISEEIGNRQLE
ncbi:MAG: biopolymer transporter ExbD [Prevotella sp.]|nr:biopolymer transporter ExbD [Prevotella sp.]MBR6320095.1 biopolymer transporter ExbD [Prevotella sp.]